MFCILPSAYWRSHLDTQHITQSFHSGQGPESQLQPGITLVDRYLIQEVIGVGGMGSVYRARDLHFPNAVKLVAVKEMINQARDPLVRQTIVQNFEREANILVTLNHPSIPRIFDYFTYDERSYLVIEYVPGKDMEALMAEHKEGFSEDQIISWGIELCDVLEYLHNHKPEPIIFRDMKPSNVMVTPNNHIVLVDFGIAKVFRVGQKGTMIGTEGYSPPEQYRGEATPQADVYALGATLHHLLTRRDPRLEPPFSFGERQIRKMNPSVSIEMEIIVNTALQYNPSDRYPTAQAMKDALTATARKTGALARLSIPAVKTATEGIKPLWTFETEDEIRGTPTVENGVLLVGSYDHNLYALNASNGDFGWKYPTDGGIVGQPLVDQGDVFIGSEDSRLHSVNLRSGKVNWTYYADGPIRCSPRLADGHILIGADDNYFHVVNQTTGRRVWRAEVTGAVRSTACVANDLIYVGCESGEVFCMNFQGEIKWRFKAKRAVTSSPAHANGIIYVGSVDSSFYALDARSGWVVWRYRLGKGSISSPVVTENLVFTGAADGYIYCLDAGNAKEVWKFKTDHQVNGSPVIHKDALYCGSVDGSVYCLEYRTGRLRWKYITDGPITGSPVVYNDVLYIGSTDHKLYALIA